MSCKFIAVNSSTGVGVLTYAISQQSALTDFALLVDVFICECKFFSQIFLLSVVHNTRDTNLYF